MEESASRKSRRAEHAAEAEEALFSPSSLLGIVVVVLLGASIGSATVIGAVTATTTPPTSPLIVGSDTGFPDPLAAPAGISVRIPLNGEFGEDWLCLKPRPRDRQRTCLVPADTDRRDLLSTAEAQRLFDARLEGLRAEVDDRFDDQERRYERALEQETKRQQEEGPSALDVLQAVVVIIGGLVGTVCTVLTVISVRTGWAPTVSGIWQRSTRPFRRKPKSPPSRSAPATKSAPGTKGPKQP